MSETCGQCGVAFGSAAELAQHLNEAHREGSGGDSSAPGRLARGASACLLCGGVFDSEQELALHNRTAHSAPPGSPISP